MKIEVIYTFDNRIPSQARSEYPIQEQNLESRQSLSDYITGYLNQDDQEKIYKISCHIMLEEWENEEVIPQWYLNCDGKLFYEDGQLKKPTNINLN